jgi:hypothetical protein
MFKPKSVDSLAEDWSRIKSRISLNKIKFMTKSPDWELAFVYAIHEWAALACGKLDEYTVSYHKASLCLEAIKDHEVRVVVLKTFNLIPKM